jgi:acyl-CoA thioesterase
MKTPERIVDKMLAKDSFSKWLGIEVLEIKEGYCKLKMEVREDMLNGFGVIHGGVTYSLADSALAFASNSTNIVSLTLNTTMNYPASAFLGDVLYAEASKNYLTTKTGVFDVKVFKSNGELTGVFRGTTYRTSEKHFNQ